MTKHQVTLVQKSWQAIELLGDDAAGVFYARLFAIAPDTAALFAATDMRSQRAKLLITLRAVVSQIHDLKQMDTQLEELGRRHTAYGVRPEHYDVVGEALIWTLEQVLSPRFSEKLRAAWIEAYGMIASRMQAGGVVRADV